MGREMNDREQYIQFPDDQVVIAQDREDLAYMSRKLKEEYNKWGLEMNLEKTTYLCVSGTAEYLELENNGIIKSCEDYKYLGIKITRQVKDTYEIRERLAQALKAIKRR